VQCLTAPRGGCSGWFGDSHSKNWKPATKPLTRLSWNSCCLKRCHQLNRQTRRPNSSIHRTAAWSARHRDHSQRAHRLWPAASPSTQQLENKWLEGVKHNLSLYQYTTTHFRRSWCRSMHLDGSPRPIMTSGQITLPNSCSEFWWRPSSSRLFR